MSFSGCVSAKWELQYKAETLNDLTNQEESLSFSLHKRLVECVKDRFLTCENYSLNREEFLIFKIWYLMYNLMNFL